MHWHHSYISSVITFHKMFKLENYEVPVTENKHVNGTFSIQSMLCEFQLHCWFLSIWLSVFYSNKKNLFKYHGWRLYSWSQFTLLLVSFTHMHTNQQIHSTILWFQDIHFRISGSWGCTHNIMTGCSRGQRQRRRSVPQRVCWGEVTSLWKCFREIFGDTIFGKWLQCSSVVGGWESKRLAVMLRVLPLIQSNSSVLPLSGHLTSYLSGCGIISV